MKEHFLDRTTYPFVDDISKTSDIDQPIQLVLYVGNIKYIIARLRKEIQNKRRYIVIN